MTKSVRRTVRVSIVSALLALIAFSFLVVGGASAQTVGQVSHHQASSQAQALPACSSNVDHIKFAKFGKFSELILTCNSMTVKAGTSIVFVDTTQFQAFIVNNSFSILFEVPQRSSASLQVTQVGQLQVEVYGTPHPQAVLNITVTP